VSEQLSYNVEQAAEKLGGPFTPDFLIGHLPEIPHLKLGKGTGRSGRIGFSELHLAEIVQMFTVEPSEPTPPTGQFTTMSTRRGRRRTPAKS
jgi:hypothetical protein